MSACAPVHEQLWQSVLIPSNVLPLVCMCMNMQHACQRNMDAAGCTTCLCVFVHALVSHARVTVIACI